LSQFSELARLNERALLRVFLISPWITASDPEFPPLARLLTSVRNAGARISVLTRRPDKASHLAAIQLIASLAHSEVLYLDTLHAKLYLLECNQLRVAMLGSPNFTVEGDTVHRELAVEVRSVHDSDAASAFIQDLFLFARELMADNRAHFRKRYGEETATA
jgi:hypothetical protein